MKSTKAAIVLALSLASCAAAAQENTVRIGYGHIDVHSKSNDFTTNGPAFLTPQPAGVNIGDASTVILGYTRRLNANFDLDFVLGVPPRHDVKGRGTLAPYGTVARVKQAAPTVFVNYNFFDERTKLRPFVGVGLNYTKFFERESTANGRLASGGPTRIDLSSSWGLAAHAGVNYKLDDRWSINGSVTVADVKSDLTATTGSIERRTRIDFRPVVYIVTAGYSF